MTSVASEAFALLNRPSTSSRAASSKPGPSDRGFASLIENSAEDRDTPKKARPDRTERVSPRQTDRDRSAEQPGPVETTARTGAPATDNPSETAGQTAEKPAAETTDPAKAAENPASGTDHKAEDTPVVTGLVPILTADLTVPAADPTVPVPAIPVVAGPVPAAPVEAPTSAAEAAPIPAIITPAPATDTPALTTPPTAPGQQQAETTGETAAPAETVAAPAATPAVPGQQQAAAAHTVPLDKVQTVNTEKSTAGDTNTDAETSVDTAQAETPDDAAKNIKPPAAQNATTTQAQTSTEKPDLNREHGMMLDDFAATPKLNADQASSQVAAHMPAHATAATAATPQASPVTTAQAVPVNAIAVEIAGQAKAGNSRFEIRLDPPELGRIDVRLDIDRDGNISSRLVIERADTYDLLRRDQSTLERALQQAGLKTSDNALEFSLRDQGFAQQQRQNDDTPRSVRALVAESDIMPSEAANGYARLLGGRSGVDIRV